MMPLISSAYSSVPSIPKPKTSSRARARATPSVNHSSRAPAPPSAAGHEAEAVVSPHARVDEEPEWARRRPLEIASELAAQRGRLARDGARVEAELLQPEPLVGGLFGREARRVQLAGEEGRVT